MKIVYIIPGSGGGFYCGNCLRDLSFINSFTDTGIQVSVIPMYLPLPQVYKNVASPVFYGAVNLYLRQKFSLFSKLPGFISKLFDSDFLLKYAARKAGTTNASGLGEMTISMLKGSEGKQKTELDQLIYWLKHHEKPDIIQISNALLSGLAPTLKTQLQCKIVCLLQDEDEWIDELTVSEQTDTWRLISENAAYIDSFIAVSNYFATKMVAKIANIQHKTSVVYNTLNLPETNFSANKVRNYNIGFLSKLNSNFGFDITIEAFIILQTQYNFTKSNLFLSGGYVDDFKKLYKPLEKKLRKLNLLTKVHFTSDYIDETRENFFSKIDILAAPSRRNEASGMQLMEAFIYGVPVIVSDKGAYPEIIEKSDAGIILSQLSAEALAKQMYQLLSDTEIYNKLSYNSNLAMKNVFSVSNYNKQLNNIYTLLLK